MRIFSIAAMGGSDQAAPFDPSTITGLKLWLKANTISLSDNDPVGTWPDQSGTSNDATQGTAGFKPLYKTNIINGLPVVRFDGSDDYLAFPTGPLLSTTFVVGKINVAPSSQPQYAPFLIFGNGADGGRICSRLSGTNWGTYLTVSGELSSGEDLVSGTPVLLEATTYGGGTFIYRNGTQKATSNNIILGPGTDQINWICGETGTSRWLSADIAEILIYDLILSTQERQNVEGYLVGKYAI